MDIRSHPLENCYKDLLGISEILPINYFLYNAIQRAIGEPLELGHEPYFIEPDISYPTYNTPKASLETLTSWLRGDLESNYPVAVLLAPAATGKTTLARELFNNLVNRKGATFFPLIVTREQWANLVYQEYIDLQELWTTSVSKLYPGAIIGAGQIERCITYGTIYPIFDGLDELCTFFPFSFNPNGTVQDLLSLFADEERGGRLLLTSRTGFWMENITEETRSRVLEIDLRPFSTPQRDQYIINRFPEHPQRRKRAHRILDRLATRTRTDVETSYSVYENLENQPYVVMLAAESADTDVSDTVEKYGNLLASDDPLEGLLLEYCERERIRHKMQATPEQQLMILEAAASEYGQEFSQEDLNLVLKVLLDLEHLDETEFKNHALLLLERDTFSFNFPFVFEYLRARCIRDWILEEKKDSNASEILKRSPQLSGSLLERCVDLILGRANKSWRTKAKNILASNSHSDEIQSSLFRLFLAVSKRESTTRSETTDQILDLFGDAQSREFHSLFISGEISSLDLTTVSFVSCRFTDVEFINCAFGEDTCFFGCRFDGRLSHENCDDFTSINVDDNCVFSTSARSVFQTIKSAKRKVKITKDQIKDSIKEVLTRFSRGHGGFTTRKQHGIRSSVYRSFSFSDNLFKSLERAEVLKSFTNSSEKMYRISNTRDARVFLDNGLYIGTVKKAADELERKLITSNKDIRL